MLPRVARVDAGTVDRFCEGDDPSVAVGYPPHHPGDVLRRVFEFGMRQRPRREQPARGPQARLEQMPARVRNVGAGHRESVIPVGLVHRRFPTRRPATSPPPTPSGPQPLRAADNGFRGGPGFRDTTVSTCPRGPVPGHRRRLGTPATSPLRPPRPIPSTPPSPDSTRGG